MAQGIPASVTTDAGTRPVDSTGSPVGVVHLNPQQSYAGVDHLLQAYVHDADLGAWEAIKARIDYTFENLDHALAPLDEATGFSAEVKARVARGQKLLFKPNLVLLPIMDPQTHAPDWGSFACTEWAFVAAVMRWFHDRRGISYYQMALGEAGTTVTRTAYYYSRFGPLRRPLTTEAAIEGKVGDLYAGWGFYFVRQYLAECLGPGQSDDPWRGYEESVAGTFIPPGQVSDKLMVYDLNRLSDDESRGRDVPVPEGVNFQSITQPKVVVGGDPNDPADRAAYPGCVLVNLPRLKIHGSTLLTNAVKNLGIGLYPMESARGGAQRWQYAAPHGTMAGVKGGIPHGVWVAELDPDTGLPRRDAAGKVITRKTGGIQATMSDVIQAVSHQGIYILHVVDAIQTINWDHMDGGQRESEGLILAGVDPVAIDLLSARYIFGNVPLAEAERAGLEDGSGSHLAQKVPLPVVEGGNIVNHSGYDCPLARDISFAYGEQRGLGQRAYYVVGRDAVGNLPLVSVRGHLGTVAGGTFADLTTRAFYYAARKLPWDLQLTSFKYLEAVDQLTGSSLKAQFLATFDENGDGAVSYEEYGTNGLAAMSLYLGGVSSAMRGTQPFGYLRGPFTSSAIGLRCRKAAWNPDGLALVDDTWFAAVVLMAYRMSLQSVEAIDPWLPSLTFGQGKWPSFEYAAYVELGTALYGSGFPEQVGVGGLYGLAFRFADATQNESRYTGPLANRPNPQAVDRYLAELASGQARSLDFVLYVPAGYGSVGGARVAHVEETDDPFRMFTASFAAGTEVWPPSRPAATLRTEAGARVH